MSALDDIATERRRQVEVEGWTQEHDDSGKGRSFGVPFYLGNKKSPDPFRGPGFLSVKDVSVKIQPRA